MRQDQLALIESETSLEKVKDRNKALLVKIKELEGNQDLSPAAGLPLAGLVGLGLGYADGRWGNDPNTIDLHDTPPAVLAVAAAAGSYIAKDHPTISAALETVAEAGAAISGYHLGHNMGLRDAAEREKKRAEAQAAAATAPPAAP
jgi:hypothetical protein